MSTRPRVVAEDTESAEFEVDSHGTQTVNDEPTDNAAQAPEIPDVPLVALGWTPEEATQLICALWNFGMLVWGPEWAADPRETAGWNISAAQLLDQFLPKGTGGFVELGAGLIMVGNGLAMMGLRRAPIIQRGPRPMWARRPQTETDSDDAQAAPAPSPASSGAYRMPADLVPSSVDPLNGIGL